MRFLHISDLHYLNDYQGKGGVYNNILNRMEDPFRQLQDVTDCCGREFDFVIVSGDICEYGELDDYLSARSKLEEYFDCPVHVCSGNHDNKDNLISAFGLEKTEGELFEVIDEEEARIIMLDSSHPDYNDGFISERSCSLLKQALSQETGKPVFVVTHHHLIKEQFTMSSAVYPEELTDILKDSNVTAIITGHTHHIYHGSFAGKPYHTTGSLSFVADTIDDGLCFYQAPSAVIIQYLDGKLTCQDICPDKDRKVLEVWPL